jgi:endo-1,4-beta-mannosidase
MGANNYYLAYVEAETQRDVLDLAVRFECNVLRIWAFYDAERPGGFCFQYWDAGTKGPRIQDGENGLVRLDRAIAFAGERRIRLILTLTNNWPDFGGMPRYVEWFGRPGKKDRFYADRRCRSAYRNYVRELVTRRNTITGTLYSDDPAILAWELANEPRCEGWLGLWRLSRWVKEMSRFVRGLDGNHLIAIGDEGNEKLLGMEGIDFGTLHLYPESLEQGLEAIRKYGGKARKPLLLEEYGMKDLGLREKAYAAWISAAEEVGMCGALLWMIGLPKGVRQPYDLDAYVKTV